MKELCLQGSGGEGLGDIEAVFDNQFPVCEGGGGAKMEEERVEQLGMVG